MTSTPLQVIKPKRNSRKKFSVPQLTLLEEAFKHDAYLNLEVLEELQTRLGNTPLSVAQIKVWFRDRRRKWRKKQPNLPLPTSITVVSQTSPAKLFYPNSRIRPDVSRTKRLKILNLRCTHSQCGILVKSKNELNQHRLEAHQLMPYPCRAVGCDEAFLRGYELAAHTYSAHAHLKSQVWYKCPDCGRSFSQSSFLRIHWVRWHEQGSFACVYPDCHFVAHKFREELKRHIYQKHYEAKWICDKCGKRFKTKSNKTMHEAVHRNNKKLESTKLVASLETNSIVFTEIAQEQSLLEYEIACKEREIIEWIRSAAFNLFVNDIRQTDNLYDPIY